MLFGSKDELIDQRPTEPPVLQLPELHPYLVTYGDMLTDEFKEETIFAHMYQVEQCGMVTFIEFRQVLQSVLPVKFRTIANVENVQEMQESPSTMVMN